MTLAMLQFGMMFRSGIVVLALAVTTWAQVPSPTPADQRGIGVQGQGTNKSATATPQGKEAKPELVLQTGYNNLFGATRLVFSPDGRLLATGTFRSNTIKLWDTANGRELRNLSGGRQSGMSLSPYIAFSNDSRLVAASAGGAAVKVWDVASGRSLVTLQVLGTEAGKNGAGAVQWIAFAPDGSFEAVRITLVPLKEEPRTPETQK